MNVPSAKFLESSDIISVSSLYNLGRWYRTYVL
jgi:hypothetical protein